MNDMFQDLFVDISIQLVSLREEVIITFVAVVVFFILGWLFEIQKANN